MNPRQRRLYERGAVGEDWNQIANFDPNKRYKWVFTGDRNHGVGYHESIGYAPEVKVADGVKALFASRKLKEGDEIVVNDHLLMSISKQEHDEIVQYGVNGDRGLAAVRAFEKKLTGGKEPWETNKRVLVPSERMNPDHFQFSRDGQQAPIE